MKQGDDEDLCWCRQFCSLFGCLVCSIPLHSFDIFALLPREGTPRGIMTCHHPSLVANTRSHVWHSSRPFWLKVCTLMTFIASPKSMMHFWCWRPWQPIPVLNRNQSAGSSVSKFVSWFNTQFWGYLPYVPYQNIISNHIISYTIYIRIMYSVSLSLYIYILYHSRISISTSKRVFLLHSPLSIRPRVTRCRRSLWDLAMRHQSAPEDVSGARRTVMGRSYWRCQPWCFNEINIDKSYISVTIYGIILHIIVIKSMRTLHVIHIWNWLELWQVMKYNEIYG